ncbi:hypothetical protein BH20ACI4_BH20ACI4_28190 [soil metagenome]
MQPCQKDSRSFFEKLQNAEGLDLRDNRGKRHNLAIVLAGVTLALLANRDGCLSSIERHLAHHYVKLMTHLDLEIKSPISRAQLPRVLEKVAVSVFDKLVFEHFGVQLNEKEKQWFAVDGKEIRGSIEAGAKRGEAVVQAASPRVVEKTSRARLFCGRKRIRSAGGQELVKEQPISLSED